MSYVEKHLIEGESIVYETRLHWIVLVAPVLLAFLFTITGVGLFIVYSRAMIIGIIFFVIALLSLVRGILMRNATEMTVTNKRVFVKVGLAARRTIELLLSRVESIGVQESVMGRMLGYGAVVIHGTGGTPETFNLVSHPLEFRTQVQMQIEKTVSK
jgi:uncharacterized membrane protein YdbT with pleckstrin-like domain